MTRLPCLLFAAAGAAITGTAAPGTIGTVTFAESRIEAGSEKFEYQFVDVDDDLRVDLFITSATGGERRLALHRQHSDGSLSPTPDFAMSVPADVVCFTVMDVRPDPGRELLLLTRSGIFSLSPAKEGLQGNLRRELALPLFPDLPDPERLPCWRLMNDVDGDGQQELLVVSDGQLLGLAAGTDAAGAPALVRRFAVPCQPDPPERRGGAAVSFGNSGLKVSSRRGMTSLFPGARSSRPTFTGEQLLQHKESISLPALVDWDGDGRRDLVEIAPRQISVRRQQTDGSFAAVAVQLDIPRSLAGEDDGPRIRRADRPALELHDVDGDGRPEIVLFRSEGNGRDKERVALIVPREADGTPAQAPTARVKLAGMDVQYDLVDVDGDRALDLVARTLDIPIGLTTLATVRVDAGLFVYRGGPGATLAHEPAFKLMRSFKPEQLIRVRESIQMKFTGDFDGDGLKDLVMTQLDGHLEVRRLERKGDRLELAEQPLASFLPQTPVDRIETWDLNDDKVSDLLLRHAKGFTLFVSRKGGGS